MQYVGITIGPIFETMQMTATPAGLWFSSYFFSSVIRDICQGLQVRGRDILTLPEGYVVREHLEDHGIGSYHDRVYYTAGETEDGVREELKEIIGQVLHQRAEEISEALQAKGDICDNGAEPVEKFLHEYIQWHAVIFSEEETKEKGIARTLADALDAMELSQQVYAEQEHSYLRKLIRGTSSDSNAFLRHYPVLSALAGDDLFPLASLQGGHVHIRDIASIGSGRDAGGTVIQNKTGKYFAIVQCDGDSMGQTIASRKERGQSDAEKKRLHQFSSLCMAYTTSSAKLVRAYGGIVIYAGGDDLLFLAPVERTGADSEYADIWELCRAVGQNFNAIFRKADTETKPSISIGLSIQYNKFPLYEAFLDAGTCLFGYAKNFTQAEDGVKNNLCLHLRKASGQAVSLTCRMETLDTLRAPIGLYDSFVEFLHDFYSADSKEGSSRNKLMHSVIYHLESQHELFQTAMDSRDEQTLKDVFANSFDNMGQSFGKGMLGALVTLAGKVQQGCDEKIVQCGDHTGEDGREGSLDVLTSMLRVAKFLVEEA